MKFAHARAFALVLPFWLLALGWLAPRLAIAATYDQGVRTFNWLALGLAACTGLWGGFLMLILALAMDQRVVKQIFKEGVRNCMASPITGMLAYGVIESARGLNLVNAPFEVSFALITLAGMGGVRFVGFLQGTATAGAPRVREGLIDVAIAWLSKLKPAEKPTIPPQ